MDERVIEEYEHSENPHIGRFDGLIRDTNKTIRKKPEPDRMRGEE